MKIITKTKNLELSGALEKFLTDKISKLEKFLPVEVQETFLEIEKETLHHRKGDVFSAEIILQLPGKKLVTCAKGSDLKKIIIEAKDEMEIAIKKYKTKKIDEPRRRIRKTQ